MNNILGIETSCDETAVAIYSGKKGLLSNQVYSQQQHAQYGGVVPELASRDHVQKLLPLLQLSLKESGLASSDIDGIAYTRGPGLLGALMVGAALSKSLAYAWRVPCLGIHHMEAHLMVIMLEDSSLSFPFLALLVSGGHTMLVKVKKLGEYELLGETLDDAVGEAFDKTAKLLGLPYPGGPELEKLARAGNCNRFDFPRPMIQQPGLDFSFSGIKTYAVNCFKRHGEGAEIRADMAASFEEAITDTLARKCQRALKQTGLNQLVVVGGVSANQRLRSKLSYAYFPKLEHSTDNAAMVAFTGWLRMSKGQKETGLDIDVQARWFMDDLKSP